MDKQSKFPIYIIGHKSGNVSKIKSSQELNFYKNKIGYDFTEIDHYPSKEEVSNILKKYKE